ncbi:alpha/beta hydrolase family protein [Nocardia lasii]|uniref:Alpha/beta hydrolase family protein n=1 Tax=Nocardia lasii TaxID=1616107 RepID=A0ABW1JL16_9NOCA
MSVLDAAVLLTTLGFAILLVAAPARARKVAPIVLSLVTIGSLGLWAVEGYWHWWPLFLLIALMFAFLVSDPDTTRRRVPMRVGIGVLAVLALLPWAMPPVPELPAPSGPYAVGSEIFRWVDEARAEPTGAGDRRNVVVQAWYPTELVSGRQWLYLDPLPPTVYGIPRVFLSTYELIDTNATAAVPVSPARERWPVVLFSPGYGAPRAVYSGLVADLASRGFVVLAIDHPYESAATKLADGTIAGTVEDLPADDPDGTRYMTTRLETRTADLRFVLDRLGGELGPLTDRLDLDTVTATGHSFGGATAISAMAADDRITAAANIDGTLYGPEHSLTRPVLLVESDRGETGHSQVYLDGNRGLLERLRAPGFRYEIGAADHYSFTDVPGFPAAPVRFAMGHLIGGSRGPAATQRLTNDLLAPFLLGRHAEVDPAATRHDRVTGGQVSR